MSMQKVDLGKVVPSAAELMQLAESAIEGWIREHTDSTPTDGHTNRLVSSDGIWKALQPAQRSWVIDNITAPSSVQFTQGMLNKEYFYSNGGFADNTLAVELPALASNGDTFFLEFRSTGGSDVPAIVSSFGVAEGGRLITTGELSNTAYCTRISATYAFGIWAAVVETFGASGGIEQQTYGTISYSPSNYASATWAAITDTVQSGNVILRGRQTGFCGMVHSGWNTSADGTGTSYGLGSEITVEADQAITLYPVYAPYTDNRTVATGSGGTYAYVESGRQATVVPALPSGLDNWKELYLYVNISVWYKLIDSPTQWVDMSFGGKTNRINSGWTVDYYNYHNRANVFQNVKITRASASVPFTMPNFVFSSGEAGIMPYVSAVIFKQEES